MIARNPVRGATALWEWFPHFLRQELQPYPGRWSIVARMTIAASLCMIIIVTFRIPYGAVGIVCAFILSRDNLMATLKSGFYTILAFGIWGALLPIGARMFSGLPLTHFLWEAATAFLCFYILKIIPYFPLAVGIVVVGTNTMTIWYLPAPAETNIELTLWQIGATIIGVVSTLLVEVLFRSFVRDAPLTEGISQRLKTIEKMLDCYSRGLPVPTDVTGSLKGYAIAGTSLLREHANQTNSNLYRQPKGGALIAIVGRCIDLSAELAFADQNSVAVNPERAAALSRLVSYLRHELQFDISHERSLSTAPATRDNSPFSQLQTTVGLLESVLEDHGLAHVVTPSEPPRASKNPLFVDDAFSNPEYVKFAVVGTAASMLCYIVYVGLNWPGISTAVTTCALTALSDTGSSRQKQMLRIAGAFLGAFVFGLGAQIFVLPYIDSIVGLMVLFVSVTSMAAYVATSGPRLSYAGLQIALAYYLINFSGFSIPLDLTIGRDRAVGVLLGIGSMWLVFENFYPSSSALQMVRLFAQAARLMSEIGAGLTTQHDIAPVRANRDQINTLFSKIDSEADAVLFETGSERLAFLAARRRVRRWLPILRTIYVLELPLLPFAPFGDPGTPPVVTADGKSGIPCGFSESLSQIAKHLEDQLQIWPIQNSLTNPKGGKVSEPPLPGMKEGGLAHPETKLSQMVEELRLQIISEPVFSVGKTREE